MLVRLAGDATGQVLTGGDGFYSFSVPGAGLYSIIPSRDFYSFTPQNVTFSNLSSDQTYDFAGAKSTYSIEVYARTLYDQAIPGATVTLSGGAAGTAQTDTRGYAVFGGLAPLGDYTVTLTKEGYTFDPPSRTWEFNFGDKGAIFRGTPPLTDGLCVTSLGPESAFVHFTGGSVQTQVGAPAGCNWVARSSVAWIRTSGPSYGTGGRSFWLSVDRNDSASPRAGTVSIGGRTFNVTQGGSKSQRPDVAWQSGGEAGGGKAVALSPDRQLLATSANGTIKIWRYADGQLLKTFGALYTATALQFTPDGQHLVAAGRWLPGSEDATGTLKMCRVSDWKEVRDFDRGSTYGFNAMRLTPDGQHLVLGTEIGTVRVVRVSDGAKVGNFGPFGARAVAVSPDGRFFAATGYDYWSELPEARVWRLSDGALVRKLTGMRFISDSISYTPDGQHLGVGDWGGAGNPGAVWLWRTSDWTLARRFEAPVNASLYTLAFSPDGRTLAAGGSDAACLDCVNNVHLWEVATGLSLGSFPALRGSVNQLIFSDNLTLYGRGGEHFARVWLVPLGAPLRAFGAARNFVTAAAFSPDGQQLATTNASDEMNTLRGAEVRRSADGSLVATLLGHGDVVNSLAYSPDGQTLAVATDHYGANLQLWRVGDGALLRSFGAADAFSSRLSFSPDGRTLVSSSASMLWFWNVEDGELLRTYGEDVGWTWPSAPAFSPDGLLLGVGRYDQTVGVLRLPTTAVEGDEAPPPGPPPVFFLPPNPEPPPEEGEPAQPPRGR